MQNNLGEVFEPENIADFERATLKITSSTIENINEIKQRSVDLYAEKFSRKAGVNRLDKFIKKNI